MVLFFINCWDSKGVRDLWGHFSFSFLPTVAPVISLQPHQFGGTDHTGGAGNGLLSSGEECISCCPWKPNEEPYIKLFLQEKDEGF